MTVLAKKQTEAINAAYLSSGMRVPGCQGNDDSVGKEADRGNDREPEGVAGPGQALARPLALLPDKNIPYKAGCQNLKCHFKGTVSLDRFKQCRQKCTELGLTMGRGRFVNFSGAPMIL